MQEVRVPLESKVDVIEFDEAEEMFDSIVETDPFRLDDLDVYSNILYVMEKSSKLAYLAQLATKTDKYRVETCCIVGTFLTIDSIYTILSPPQLSQYLRFVICVSDDGQGTTTA